MDDRRIGAALRAIRIQHGWRQVDLARRARVSASVVGRIERGDAASITLGKVRRVANSLGAQLEAFVRWDGAELPRLLDARHAAMHEAVAGLFAALEGWVIEPEVSFFDPWRARDHRHSCVAPRQADAARHRAQDGSRRGRDAPGQNGPAPAPRLECRSSIRLGSRRRQHLGPYRRGPHEPSGRLGASIGATREVPLRWSRDAPLAARPARARRRPRFPAKSPRGEAWARCYAGEAGPRPSAWHGNGLSYPIKVPKSSLAVA